MVNLTEMNIKSSTWRKTLKIKPMQGHLLTRKMEFHPRFKNMFLKTRFFQTNLPAYSMDHFFRSGIKYPAIRGISVSLNHCTKYGCFIFSRISMCSLIWFICGLKLKHGGQVTQMREQCLHQLYLTKSLSLLLQLTRKEKAEIVNVIWCTTILPIKCLIKFQHVTTLIYMCQEKQKQ